jgi:hypothetical protein
MLFFVALRWYRFECTSEYALIFSTVPDRLPTWLRDRWAAWGGHTIGNAIVLNNVSQGSHAWDKLIKHESQHCIQAMRGGVFWLVAYLLNILFIKWMCAHSDSYYDSVFEIDARRAAGQTIDVVGVKQRMHEKLVSK